MVNALWIASFLAGAGSVTPAGSPAVAEFGKKPGVFTGSDGAVAFDAKGPATIVFEVRAEGAAAENIEISVLRDDRYRSKGSVALKPAKKDAPANFILLGKFGLNVAAGDHKLIVSAGGRKLALLASTGKLTKPFLFENEEDTGATKAAAASPAPKKEDAASSVASALAASDEAVSGANSDAAIAVQKTGLAQAMRVAVYDFELSGVDPNIGAVVTDSMLAEVRKLQGISAIGMDEIRDMLSHEANKQFLGCEANESCLAEIAGALGVDDLVSGKLAKVDDGVVFVARRIDQKRAKVVGVVNQRLKSEGGQEFLAAIGPSVEQLFPDHPLREGLSRGVPKEMALRLDPPPLPRWSVYAVAGGAVAAALAGSFFGLKSNSDKQSFQDLAETAQKEPVSGAQLTKFEDGAKTNASRANIGFLSAGVLAVTAGVMALFTDWYGYGDAAATAGPVKP